MRPSSSSAASLVLSPVWAQVLEGLAFGIHPKKEIDLARGLDYLLLQLASYRIDRDPTCLNTLGVY